jgi:nucleotide-binding universal stress UspA family protein
VDREEKIMKRFENILVVCPPGVETTETMKAAERLAERNGARITVFDAVPPIGITKRRSADYSTDDLRRMVEQARSNELAEIAAGLSVEPEIVVSTGTLYLEVIRRTIAFEHDLVMMPPDQEQGVPGLWRASNTMHLLRKCPVPVWVYRAADTGTGDVLAAIGPVEEAEPSPLDRKIIELGSSLAALQGGRFHLVHAWGLRGETLLRNGRVSLPVGEVDQLVEDAWDTAHTAVDKLLADTGIPAEDVSIHLSKGDPFPVITELATAINPDVVVMGTLARSGVAGMLIGNTAEKVLGSLDTSVLAVKPNGFTTPVSLP